MKQTSRGQSKPAVRRRAETPTARDIGELIADLGGIWGPPGREDAVRQHVVREISSHVDHMQISPLGAVHAIAGRGAQPRMMIAAHMDEVGVMVSHLDSSGFARFGLLGKKDPKGLVGHTVRFTGELLGLVRAEAGTTNRAVSLDKLFLDFGSPERVGPRIKIGDVGCLVSEQRRIGDRFIGSNAGGRSGVALLIHTLQSLARPSGEVQFVFSVQGEFGGDGGLTSATTLGPQAALIVGAAPADDIPGGSIDPIRLGGGPVLVVRHGSTASHPRVLEAIASVAKKRKIGTQSATLEASLPGAGLPSANGGVMTAWICIPCRGHHTASEMVDLGDVEATALLLTALAQSRLEWM